MTTTRLTYTGTDEDNAREWELIHARDSQFPGWAPAQRGAVNRSTTTCEQCSNTTAVAVRCHECGDWLNAAAHPDIEQARLAILAADARVAADVDVAAEDLADAVRRLGCVDCGEVLDEFAPAGRDGNGALRGRCSPACASLDLGCRIFLHRIDVAEPYLDDFEGTCSTLFDLMLVDGEHDLAAGETVLAFLIDEDGRELGRRTILVDGPVEPRSKQAEAVEAIHSGCQAYALWLLAEAAKETGA